jgi:uncharacterized protein YceK
MTRIWLAIIVAVAFSGCLAGVIMMQDPKSGAVYECRRGDFAPLWTYSANEDCAQALERAGWKRL